MLINQIKEMTTGGKKLKEVSECLPCKRKKIRDTSKLEELKKLESRGK